MIAVTPEPPYLAVIFTTLRALGDPDDGYAETAARMDRLAAEQPGYLGVESVRDAEGFGITVSYWRDADAVRGWRDHLEHAAARARGRAGWYRAWALRVAAVERAAAGEPR